jgi:hypothetical protein
MTDLFAYHVAKEQMADLRRTAGQTRLRRTASNHRALTSSRRVITRVLSRVSTRLPIDHRTANGASHTRAVEPDAPHDAAGEIQ